MGQGAAVSWVDEISHYHLSSSVKCKRYKRPSQEGDRKNKKGKHSFSGKKKRYSWKGFSYIAQMRAEWSILVVSVSTMAGQSANQFERHLEERDNRGTRRQDWEVKMKSLSCNRKNRVKNKKRLSKRHQQSPRIPSRKVSGSSLMLCRAFSHVDDDDEEGQRRLTGWQTAPFRDRQKRKSGVKVRFLR